MVAATWNHGCNEEKKLNEMRHTVVCNCNIHYGLFILLLNTKKYKEIHDLDHKKMYTKLVNMSDKPQHECMCFLKNQLDSNFSITATFNFFYASQLEYRFCSEHFSSRLSLWGSWSLVWFCRTEGRNFTGRWKSPQFSHDSHFKKPLYPQQCAILVFVLLLLLQLVYLRHTERQNYNK